jgi:tetratricopeptide (TPR) repeat protein
MDSAQIDSLWDWGDPVASEARFRQAGTAEAMTQVARALGLQGKIGEAHRVLDSIDKSDPIVNARATLERGRLHNDAGDKGAAVASFRDALKKAEDCNADYYVVDSLHMIAICENDIEAHRVAIRKAEESSDARTRSWDASLLNNLGWTLFEQGAHSDALQCFREALEKRESRGEGERTHVAKWCVARALREVEQYDEALEVLYALLEAEDSDGFVQDEIGENLVSLGNLEGARPYFAEAAALLADATAAGDRRAQLGRAGRFAQIGRNSISVSRAFQVDTNIIWMHIVSRHHLPKWLGTVVPTGDVKNGDGELLPGMTFDLHIDNKDDDVVPCVVLQCIYPRKLVLQWDESTLSISVVENTLTLTHEGIEDLATYGAAWHSAIDLLSHVMAGGSRGSFVENYGALFPEYERLISRTRSQETR